MRDQEKIGILKNLLQEKLDGKKKFDFVYLLFMVVQVLFRKMGKKSDTQEGSFSRGKLAQSKKAAKGRARREGERSSKLLSKRQHKKRQERGKSLSMAEAKRPHPEYPEILILREEKKKKKKKR